MSIEDDIAAVRSGRGTPDQQMIVVSVLDALLRPSGTLPKGILPDEPKSRENASTACEIRCDCPKGWCARTGSLERVRDEPVVARYESDGYNNWGTRYHARCDNCGSDLPTNMYGMGTCTVCGHKRNPLTDVPSNALQSRKSINRS